MAWCNHVSSTSCSPRFRSKELDPGVTLSSLFFPPNEPLSSERHIAGMRAATNCVRNAIRRRRALIREKSLEVSFSMTLHDQFFLLYEPSMSSEDGILHSISDGFFDASEGPAHDTWITYCIDEEALSKMVAGLSHYGKTDFLVSWVPPTLLTMVQECVKASIDESVALVPGTELLSGQFQI